MGISELKKRPSEIYNGNTEAVEESAFVDQEDQFIGGGFTSLDEIKDARPQFLKEEYIKDINGHRPDHPDYDPSTLWVPFKTENFTPAMTQYW